MQNLKRDLRRIKTPFSKLTNRHFKNLEQIVINEVSRYSDLLTQVIADNDAEIPLDDKISRLSKVLHFIYVKLENSNMTQPYALNELVSLLQKNVGIATKLNPTLKEGGWRT